MALIYSSHTLLRIVVQPPLGPLKFQSVVSMGVEGASITYISIFYREWIQIVAINIQNENYWRFSYQHCMQPNRLHSLRNQSMILTQIQLDTQSNNHHPTYLLHWLATNSADSRARETEIHRQLREIYYLWRGDWNHLPFAIERKKTNALRNTKPVASCN